jgi:hypothetical protein
MSVVYWLGAAITWIEMALTYRCWFCAIYSLIVRQNEDLMAQPGGDILWSIQLRRIDQTSQAVALQHPTDRQQGLSAQGGDGICYIVS